MFENNKFTVKAGDKEIVCDVLFTYHSPETGKDYMAFTDQTKDRAGNVNVFYATFDPNAEEMAMAPIETQAEWTMVRDLMNGWSQNVKEQITQQMRKPEETEA